ncbi:hypothetical protein SHIRM173S_08444 [Streptomyces hirsutus]
MLWRLPTSLTEAQNCMAEGAVPIGGATLVWALWQRDGFPEQAMSLRSLPEATVVEHEALGAAVCCRIDAPGTRFCEVRPHRRRRCSAPVRPRWAAIVGSTLRCLLPAALGLDTRHGLRADFKTRLAEMVRQAAIAARLARPPGPARAASAVAGASGGRAAPVDARAVARRGGGPAQGASRPCGYRCRGTRRHGWVGRDAGPGTARTSVRPLGDRRRDAQGGVRGPRPGRRRLTAPAAGGSAGPGTAQPAAGTCRVVGSRTPDRRSDCGRCR